MKALQVEELMKLEDYAEQRPRFRERVIAHKRHRKLHLGPHMTLLFEYRLTVQYQVQEMLRIERIFERKAIQEELEAYNPLIPDGRNWKATCLIEYEDVELRRRRLAELRGVESRLWAAVGAGSRIAGIANEDLARSDEHKTAAVHFLRFELDAESAAALRAGAVLRFGVDHPAYLQEIEVPAEVRASLLGDLEG
jgi:hypothetical protein